MKKLCAHLRSTRGDSNLLSAIFVVPVLLTLVVLGIVMLGQMSKLDDMQQIARLMAREISLRGEVNSAVDDRLTDLEQLYHMEVDMKVTGDYIGSSKKLKLESSFVVEITYQSSYGIGGIVNLRRDTTYVRKASGIVEEYHK